MTILKYPNIPARFAGCDFIVETDNPRPRLLQLTDMQVIDSAQRRTPDRIRADEIEAWRPEAFDAMCADHIRSLVAQTRPDLIFITGDIVYGEFDDSGKTLARFCAFMESLQIPWAPVFGNHDNESKQGVAWQCDCLESLEYCLFSRGKVTGNGNYTVGIVQKGSLLRVIHMIDSNGCRGTQDPLVQRDAGIYPDQIQLFSHHSQAADQAQGRPVPSFAAFHIPTEEFELAARKKGYAADGCHTYNIGVNVPGQDADFGYRDEKIDHAAHCPEFPDFLKIAHVDGVFAGHCHKINTCITCDGVTYTFGLKTGQYDYHTPGQIGGTLITLDGEAFTVSHVPALVKCGAYPSLAPMFQDFFTKA